MSALNTHFRDAIHKKKTPYIVTSALPGGGRSDRNPICEFVLVVTFSERGRGVLVYVPINFDILVWLDCSV